MLTVIVLLAQSAQQVKPVETGNEGANLFTLLVANLFTFLGAALWPAVFLALIFVYRESVAEVLRQIALRARLGAALKIGSVELGQIYVDHSGTPTSAGICQTRNADGTFISLRDDIYQKQRHLHVVHRVAISLDQTQLYDVIIYVVPSQYGSLNSVRRVDYFFGQQWGNKVSSSDDRARGFPVATSAYGPFLCLARLSFVDGPANGDVSSPDNSVFISRFIDFEMGASLITVESSTTR
jgi:hypothetical protein